MKHRPVIGVACCLRSLAFGDYPPTPHHVVFHKYADFVTQRLKAIPVLIPATPQLAGSRDGLAALVDRLDGLLLPGSPSNVGIRYTDEGPRRITPRGTADYARDMMTTSLIRACVEDGIPLLGICRGLQEMNVAFGGELHEEVHLLPGHRDHRSDKLLPYDQRYLPRHEIRILPGSSLDSLLASAGVRERVFRVNSLHGQAVSKAGASVRIAALADDDVVEAICLDAAPSFAVGVQWHIEWAGEDQVLDRCVADAFRIACELRAGLRHAMPRKERS